MNKGFYCKLFLINIFAISWFGAIANCSNLALNSSDETSDASPGAAFYLQGQRVSKQRYQAAILANEGLMLMRTNNNEDAATRLKQAVALAPDLPEAHHNLGLVLAKLGNLPDAIEELGEAIKLKPDLDASWLTLGGLYQSAGEIDKAINRYEEFLARFPKHAMHAKIANLLLGLKKEKDAIEHNNATNRVLRRSNNGSSKGLERLEGSETNFPESRTDDYVAEITRQGVFRWPGSRIPIRVFLHSGSGVPGFKSSYENILKQSFADWSKASEGLVKFAFVDKPQEAYLECHWTDDPKGLRNPAEAGEAKVYTDQDGIRKGEIWLLTQPLSPILPLTENRLRMICLHEIGHSLGMAGHTSNPEDIMFYSVSFKDQWRELSGRDSRTIARLYTNN